MKIENLIDNISAASSADRNYNLADDSFYRIVGGVDDYAIFLMDVNGTITSWNVGAEKIEGYAAAEIIGQHFKLFFPREEKESGIPDQYLEEAMLKGSAHYDGWFVRKDGQRYWANATLSVIRGSLSEPMGFVNITRDATDKKIAEDAFSNYAEDLKHKNEELRKSEERYQRMIAEVENYAIVLLDRDGKVIEWNRGAEKLKGYTAEEIRGRSSALFYPKESKDANLPQQLLDEAVMNGSVIHEGWRVRKDGSRFWSSVSITALHDSAGEVIGFVKVTRDLTDKKIAEDRLSALAETLQKKNIDLKNSEARYHHMIAEVRDYAIILLDTQGNIENWNAGAEYIKGYSTEEILGKNFSIFYTTDDRTRQLPQYLLKQAREQGRATHEGWRVRKDGTRFWGSIVITALHNSDGAITGYSKVTRDLTDQKSADDLRKQNAEQLNHKNRQLEQVNNELRSFTYVASHDLKEPLRKIKTFASLLSENQSLTDNDKKYVSKIEGSADRMQRLIDDLLSYSLVSNDLSKFEMVDLNEVLQTVKNDLEVFISEKNATIETEQLPIIEGIGFQWVQLFLNLFSNSLKFSKPNLTPHIRVSCTIEQSPAISGVIKNSRYYQISVRDNGIGFEQKDAGKVFEVFQRLHSYDSFSGTGIGLAIVKKVVDNHQGLITVESEPDVGTVFKILLPCDAS